MQPESDSVQFDKISDGYDDGSFMQAHSNQAYLARLEAIGSKPLEAIGSKPLAELIKKHESSTHPIDCIVYDAVLPWALDVAKQFGLVGAAFYTQSCAVNYISYHMHHGLLKLPISSPPVSIPGLPLLDLPDMPSFIYVPGSYAAYFELLLNQFSNVDKADWILVNTFYKLEDEVRSGFNVQSLSNDDNWTNNSIYILRQPS